MAKSMRSDKWLLRFSKASRCMASRKLPSSPMMNNFAFALVTAVYRSYLFSIRRKVESIGSMM